MLVFFEFSFVFESARFNSTKNKQRTKKKRKVYFFFLKFCFRIFVIEHNMNSITYTTMYKFIILFTIVIFCNIQINGQGQSTNIQKIEFFFFIFFYFFYLFILIICILYFVI
jgi:hypothetical protein